MHGGADQDDQGAGGSVGGGRRAHLCSDQLRGQMIGNRDTQLQQHAAAKGKGSGRGGQQAARRPRRRRALAEGVVGVDDGHELH